MGKTYLVVARRVNRTQIVRSETNVFRAYKVTSGYNIYSIPCSACMATCSTLHVWRFLRHPMYGHFFDTPYHSNSKLWSADIWVRRTKHHFFAISVSVFGVTASLTGTSLTTILKAPLSLYRIDALIIHKHSSSTVYSYLQNTKRNTCLSFSKHFFISLRCRPASIP